jgi:hypothetical protein
MLNIFTSECWVKEELVMLGDIEVLKVPLVLSRGERVGRD